jgi:transposase
MMGRQQDDQAKLFYEFCLEDRVPSNHLLSKIDQFVDLSELRAHLASYYSNLGRPSVDPDLMIRMLIIVYCFGIRSERRLCEEVDLNLAYRWFCRLGLESRVPDHSTFSKARHGRFRDSDAFRHVFETVVQRAMMEGLVGGEGFAVDASLIAADANKQRSAASSDDTDWQTLATTRRSVREYLDTLDHAAWGAASEVAPKFVSRSDPASQWTGAHKGHAFFAYADNYLIDLKAAIILDVEPTRAIRQAEVGAAKTMIDRTEECFGLKPQRLCGDTAYGAAEILGWMVEEKSVTKDNTRIYRASQRDCGACALKESCCPGQPRRKIPRSIHEAARDVVRRLAGTPEYRQSRRERKKIEMLFAHLKRILKLNRLRLRGPCGARDEFLLAAIAQNLRKLAKLVSLPPPDGGSQAIA